MADEGKTTVIKTGGGNGGSIAILALALVVLAVVLFLIFGQGMLGNGKKIDANVKIDTPAKP